MDGKGVERALTAQQEAFCLAFATPDSQGRYPKAYEAYFKAYPNCGSKDQAYIKSSLLLKDPRVRGRIEEIREQAKREYLEDQLPYKLLVDKILEGTNATTVKTATLDGCINDEREYADHATRRPFIELALKLTGNMPPDRQEITGADGTPLHTEGPVTELDRLQRLTAIFDAARARRDGHADAGGDSSGAGGVHQPDVQQADAPVATGVSGADPGEATV